uniref:Solute carrier organic anion transporter family member 4A1 n=1 Tax=Plectus sambesii TaxID=2011161 RepID=A0A914UN79_9BILA
MWTDCTCANSLAESRSVDLSSFDHQVVSGLCETTCGGVLLFMIVFSLLVLATFCSAMPIQQAVLRVVPFQQRTMSLGYGWLFMRCFGSIPGAVFFGMAIDNTCILWKTDCGEKQTCLRYSSHDLSFAIFAFAIGLKTLIVFSLAIAYWFYRPPADSSEVDAAQITARIKPEDSKPQIISSQRG